ncbi:hypothetical protein [Polyangium sorediatum]|uniref:Secreted protein n=1 Tax=Polyangium sorediatum TaxID=889274 RepID=A0ABT6NRZ4_9BACT|nr:hypothetical protein [Polyangium sorediatum]MDI1431106.1 hypothetical protein [Polyangium sorediatum]
MSSIRATMYLTGLITPAIASSAFANPNPESTEQPIDQRINNLKEKVLRLIDDCKKTKCDFDTIETSAASFYQLINHRYRYDPGNKPSLGSIFLQIIALAESSERYESAKTWTSRLIEATTRDNTDNYDASIRNLKDKLAKLEQKIASKNGGHPEATPSSIAAPAISRKSVFRIAGGISLGGGSNWSPSPYQFSPTDPASLLVERRDDDTVSNHCRDIGCAVDANTEPSRSFQLLPLFFWGIEGSLAHVSEDREISLAGVLYSAPYGVRGIYGGIGYATSSDPFEFLCWKPWVRIGGTLLVGSTILRKVSPTTVTFNNDTLSASAGAELSSWIGPQLGARLELDLMFRRSVDIGFGVHPSFLASYYSQVTFWIPIVFRSQWDLPLKTGVAQ